MLKKTLRVLLFILALLLIYPKGYFVLDDFTDDTTPALQTNYSGTISLYN